MRWWAPPARAEVQLLGETLEQLLVHG
eukprot:COSAG06_NODE_29334_length_558_cov_1.261438_1_plen_26_part_10